MVQIPAKSVTNVWSKATWDEYLQLIDHPAYAKAKGYYFNGHMRIETVGVGPDHAGDNGLIHVAITLFCALKGIPIKGLINCSYRKPGVREAQPDVSYYIGDRVAFAPQGSSITDLDHTPPPDLAIEISDSSISEDLGQKRLLYEEMNIAEYWVVDVENAQIIAFQIAGNGSKRISQSGVLAGLEIELIRKAIKQRRQLDDAQIAAWLMTAFQNSNPGS